MLKTIKHLITQIATTPWGILMRTIDSIIGVIQTDEAGYHTGIDSRELIPTTHDDLGIIPDWLSEWGPPGAIKDCGH